MNNPITCNYTETCIVDFLQDHHNRDGELLLGISLAGQTAEDAIENLWEELCQQDWEGLRLSEQTITEDHCRTAFAEAVDGVDFRPFDENGLRLTGPEDPDWDTSIEDGESQAWFLLTWKVSQ